LSVKPGHTILSTFLTVAFSRFELVNSKVGYQHYISSCVMRP